uniref:Putative chloroplast RNA helicase VDL' isoform 3 n=1 Tax=Nicotiana tabacum TaxID=4097 RepID=Q9FE23_TOBAC|nr:putative chloroplast RNA helicase VDL' isoform 3 [Nicotiana tabacum]AAG38495.1 putative chloroplast RNA helicase VDL' isoform 3 [Nicotiana tabacum]
MACFSATQLHTLLWTSSLNRTSHHFKPNYTYRTPKFLFRQKPLIASFSTSDIEARTETKDSSTATPRELCHGHVPEHVIRRVEEVGYVIPTEVQLLALPFLYSGRDCVLHAQLKFIFSFTIATAYGCLTDNASSKTTTKAEISMLGTGVKDSSFKMMQEISKKSLCFL